MKKYLSGGFHGRTFIKKYSAKGRTKKTGVYHGKD
jgi:hypothetical protein